MINTITSYSCGFCDSMQCSYLPLASFFFLWHVKAAENSSSWLVLFVEFAVKSAVFVIFVFSFIPCNIF